MRHLNLVKSLTRVINNRKGLLILCLSLATFGVNDAWGQTYNGGTWYSLYNDTEYKNSDATLDVVAPTNGSLTFQYKKEGWAVAYPIQKITITQSTNEGKDYTSVGSFESGAGKKVTSYTSAGNYTILQNINRLKFDDHDGTLTRYFRYIRVPLKKHILLKQDVYGTSELSHPFGDVKINTVNEYRVELRSFLTAGDITITTSDANIFHINSKTNTEQTLEYKVGNNACASANGSSGVNAGGGTLGDINKYNFTIYFTPTEEKDYSGKVTISDGTNTATVNLSGKATKLDPSITWSSDDATFNVDDVLSATNGAGLTVTLSSTGNEQYVNCSGNTATMLEATTGTITITANVTGNDIYNSKSFTKDITITNKEKQYITWNQDFSKLKTTDTNKTITLNAEAVDKDGNKTGLPVSYELVGDKTGLSLSQNSNTWTLTYSTSACKNTTIIAKQEGNATYAPASNYSLPVKVIDPTQTCSTGETLINSDVKLENTSTYYNIDIPSSMTIDVRRSKTGIFDVYLQGFDVELYSGANAAGTQLSKESYSASDINNSKTIVLSNLNINAKSVKLISHANNGYTVTSLTYTHYHYCNADKAELNYATYPNTKTDAKQVVISYANYPIEIECSSNKIGIDKSSFGDCGVAGSETINVTYTTGANTGNETEYIYVKDNTGATLKTITINVSIQKVSQNITSTSIVSSYKTTDKIELSATSNSGLTNFEYSCSPSDVASFEGNIMTFNKSCDNLSIMVTQPGDNVYSPCSTTVNNIKVSKVTPAISTNPTATITYGLQLNTVTLSGGAAKVNPFRGLATDHAVEGTFSWTNGGYTVIETGGTTHEYDVTFTPSGTEAGMYNSVQGKATVTVNKVTPTLEVTNPEAIKIYIDDTLTPKIDLVSCIKNYSAESDSHGHTQNKSAITYSCGQTGAVIKGKMFHATAAGTYTITATAPATDYYNEASETITITVGKHTPSITWKTFEHIYAGDILEDVASTSFLDNPVELELTYEKVSGEFVVEGNKLLIDKQYTVAHEATVKVTTTETDYYAPTSEEHTYYLEVKKLPKFYLNGVEMSTETENNLTLKVGETANVSFEQIEESAFTYTTNAQFVSYAHNSENHTGVITATASGNEGFQFHQAGTSTVFDRTCQMHIWVNKHADTLDSPIHDNDIWMVDSVYTGEMYTIKDDGYTGHTQEGVSISCDNESVIRYQQDGSWKAVGEGTATITIKQINNAYWTGDTITRIIKVQKHTPVITWNIDGSSYAWGSVINNPVSSTNTDVPFTITSNNPSVANYVNGRIEVYNTTGSVTFTLAQEGNYKWNAAKTNLTKSFSTFQPANHVPFTLTSDNKGNFEQTKTSDASWKGSGYKLGDGFWISRTNSVTIRFTGIPNKLSFVKTLDKSLGQLPGDGQCNCYVYESADGSSWSECWRNGDRVESVTASNIQLQPTTRYIKFEYQGTVYANYSSINVTERSSIEPVANSLDFGTGYNGNTAAKRTVDVNWYSVMPCTVAISGADASQFYLAEDSKTIASMLDNSGSTTLSVFYTHEENKTHSATLTITSGDTPAKTATIQLSGTTDRAPQEIIWREDITPLPHDGGIYEGAALASSGGEVVLTSDDESIVKVVGNGLQPVGVGKTTVHAYQAGDDIKWQPVNAEKEIEVTSLSVQHLIWNDQLNNIKRTNGQTVNITLTAQSDAVASDPSLVVTYELDDNAKTFASVSGNQLTITGWGSGYITAKQAGNANYIATQKVKPIISRNPDADCKMLAGEYWEEYTLHTIASKEIDILNGEPATIEFDAKMDLIAVGEGLHLDEWYDNSWHEFKYIDWDVMAKNLGNYAHYGPYNLNRKTTKVRFYTNTGATMTRTFKNVEITLARYLELAQNDMSFAGVDKGAFLDQTFYINYSNLRGTLDVGLQNTSSNLQVITTTVGNDCGEIGQMVPVKIRCTGNVCGTENNVIVLSNKEQKLEVPVSATVVPPSQNITWNPQTTILTTDFVALNATCTSNLPISYSSNNTDVATVQQDGSGVWSMTIIKDGTVTITASQAGNADWSPAPDKNVTFNISKATPIVTTWATPSEVVKWTTLANTPLTGGEASVSGTFSWQDGTEQVERGNSGYTMVFTPTNTNWYNTVTNTVVVPVSKDPQTITWNYSPQPIFCNAQLTFDATASSGLTVRYETSDANVAYVNGNNLVIISGGKVTITAIQDGDDTWAYASLSKEIEILRWTPTIKTLPTANSMLIGQLLDNATLTGGVAVVNEKPVDGSFAWKEGSTTTIDVAGTATRTVIFTPSNPNHYNSTTCEVSVEVNKYAPVIAHNLTASTITYGQALNVSTLNGTLTATDKVKQPNVEVEGIFGWFDPTLMLNAGGQTAIVRFSPTNSDWYNYVDIEIPVQVNKATANATPSAAAIKYGQKVSESNLTNGGTTPGTWTWTDNKKEDILPVGVHDHLSVHFVPTDNTNYLEADGEVSLTVNKATPTLTWTEKANTANALEQKTFTASSTNTDANAVITYSITSGTDCATIDATTGVVTMIKKGTITITASQVATENFTEASAISTTCEISPAPTQIVTLPTINGGTPIEIGTQLNGLVLTGGEVQNTINNNGVEGTFAITGGNIFTVGATSITITFTPNNTEVYAGCSTNAEVTIHADDYYQFTGNDNTSWTNGSNWGGTKGTPSSDEDAKVIIVSGTLDITSNENVNVTDLTILPTGTVHVHGDLSVNGTTIEGGTYGDLFVHNGGIATIGNDASLTVNNFVIETSIGTEGQSASGQVHNESNIIYTTGAYIDINMDPSGKMDDTQWYAFTVPFPVDVQNGVARKEGDVFRKCTYGVEYFIAEYDMTQRLNTGKGWKYIKSGQLQPGRFYYFTVNGDYNVYSFKAAENTITINNTTELRVNGEGPNANWNAVGNTTLTYATISGENVPAYVQTYVNGESRYITVATDDAQFVVGCPFFFQASETATMILNEANETVDAHYAPRQESVDKPVCVRIAEEGKHFSDQIYLTASQEATREYTLGRDLAKAGIGTKSAQLWMNAYGQKLSVQDATLMGDQAYYELSIYAPQAGSYELSLPKVPANAVIYLTQNGYPIWNLNEMPYVIECYKGTTNEYGLLLRLQEGGSPTDMQTMRSSEKVQKIMKNQRIYINANSQLYDLMGQKVK